jgi:hypothetical protein
MANELTVSCSVRLNKNSREVNKSYGGVQIDVTGDNPITNIQNIGTSEEAIVVGDVGTAGYFMAKNLDDTNYVTIRAGAGVADLVKLKAGEVCLFRLAMNGPYAIADTAACDLEVTVIPD